MGFQVEQIDHVEVFVPDRRAAAKWYSDVLGLSIVAEHEHWADDPRGPLMIATPHGNTKLALFVGEPERSRAPTGFHLVAFRVGSKAFAEFLTELPQLKLTDDQGREVTKDLVADHGSAYSVYFCDPYGHSLEITTYDYEETRTALQRLV